MVKREGIETFAHTKIVELIYILFWGMVGVGSEGGFWTKKTTWIVMTLDEIQNTREPADCSAMWSLSCFACMEAQVELSNVPHD